MECDSDWCESDDDLIGDDQVGELDSFTTRPDPSDRVQDGFLDAEISDSNFPCNTTAVETSLNQPDSDEEASIPSSIYTQDEEPTDTSPSPCMFPVSAPFLPSPGPITTNMDEDVQHPYFFFTQMWSPSIFHDIAEQTNLYAAQKGTQSWEKVSETEIQLFVGLQLAMGLVRLPALQDYWSSNQLLGTPGITKRMGRNRFRAILSHLHLCDNSKMPQRGEDGYDKLYKIRPLWDIVKGNMQSCYQPHQTIAVDETMILLKGRSTMKQYMPLKPVNRGYKVWCACDSTNGMVYNVDMYTGAVAGRVADEDGLGSYVVQKLMEPLFGKKYHVYMDNFFSSVSLAEKLREKDTYMIGTTRVNRKQWPTSLRDMKGLNEVLERGESKTQNENGIECVVWKDNKAVPFINTIADPSTLTNVHRRNKDGSRREVSCPHSVQLYSKYMGGVDLFNSRRKSYSSSKKSKKWWLRIYYFLLDTCSCDERLRSIQGNKGHKGTRPKGIPAPNGGISCVLTQFQEAFGNPTATILEAPF
jgi:hypothetical protein